MAAGEGKRVTRATSPLVAVQLLSEMMMEEKRLTELSDMERDTIRESVVEIQRHNFRMEYHINEHSKSRQLRSKMQKIKVNQSQRPRFKNVKSFRRDHSQYNGNSDNCGNVVNTNNKVGTEFQMVSNAYTLSHRESCNTTTDQDNNNTETSTTKQSSVYMKETHDSCVLKIQNQSLNHKNQTVCTSVNEKEISVVEVHDTLIKRTQVSPEGKVQFKDASVMTSDYDSSEDGCHDISEDSTISETSGTTTESEETKSNTRSEVLVNEYSCVCGSVERCTPGAIYRNDSGSGDSTFVNVSGDSTFVNVSDDNHDEPTNKNDTTAIKDPAGVTQGTGTRGDIDVDETRGNVHVDGTRGDVHVDGDLTVAVRAKRRIWCERCNSRLVEYKRQAIKMWMPFASKRGEIHYEECDLLSHIEENLCLPSHLKDSLEDLTCRACANTLPDLRTETVTMVQNLERTQAAMSAKNKPPGLQLQHFRNSKQDNKPPKIPKRVPDALSSGTNVESERAVTNGSRSRIPQAQSGQTARGHSKLPQSHRSLKQRSQSANVPNTSSNTRSDQKERSRSHDLPPRKDSPFPQAIAAEKHSRRHTGSGSQQQHAWVQQTRKAFQQMLTQNGRGRHSVQQPPSGTSGKLSSATDNNFSRGYPLPADMARTGTVDYSYLNGNINIASNGIPPTQQKTMTNQNGRRATPIPNGTSTPAVAHRPAALKIPPNQPSPPTHGALNGGLGPLGSPGAASSCSTGSSNSAAASFFARAAQRFSISSKKRKKKDAPEPEPPPFPTNFRDVIRYNPPPMPPCLYRHVGKVQGPAPGKVKVMLRIFPVEGASGANFLCVDARKKQISVTDPTTYQGYTTPSLRRPMAPRLYEFDAIFPQDDSLAEMCGTSLGDILQSVVNGSDGCLFCYGHARLGKTYSMIGVDDGPQNLGVIPCALAWLFRLIDKHKERTGARFSVRVSAVEVTGKQEALKDLLADVARGQEGGREQAPGVYLREDPICGTQLENQSELRATSAEQAAYYLDAAIGARTIPEAEEDSRNSHLLFTVHVYQYRVEKGARSSGTSLGDGFDGGRSRLHLIDLGSCSRGKDTNALSLSSLGNVIQALLQGQRNLPFRGSKLTQLLKESMGNSLCQMCMIAHVSSGVQSYNETLQVIQLASKIHRTRRRNMKKFSGTSSDDSSSCDSESFRVPRRIGSRTGIRMGTLREMSHSDPDYTSSSEQSSVSCDTVIYRGGGSAYGRSFSSDQEGTDNEHPPSALPVRARVNPLKPQPRTVPNFSRSRSSGDEGSETDRASSVGSPAHDSRSPAKDPRLNKPVPPSLAKPNIPPSSVALAQLQNKKSMSSMSVHLQSSARAPVLSSANVSHSYTDSCLADARGNTGGQQYGPIVPGYYSQQGHSPYTVGSHGNHNQTTPTNEHWIDGPMMPPAQPNTSYSCYANVTPTNSPQHYPASSSSSNREHWVDGPNAPPNPVNQKALNEQWIDGPSAFVVTTPEPNAHESNSRPRASPNTYCKQHQSRAQLKRHETELRQAAERQQILTDITPRSGSRTNVLETIEESKHETNTLDKPKAPVPSFVSDWLEKHNGGVSSDGTTDDERRTHKSRHHRHEKLKHSGEDLLSPRHRKSKSNQSSPRSSPHLSKHRRDNRSHSEEKAKSRTQAWVESVSSESRTHCDGQEATYVPETATNKVGGNAPPTQSGELMDTMADFNDVIATLDQELRAKEACSAPRGDEDLSPPPDYDTIVLSDQLQNNAQHRRRATTDNQKHTGISGGGDCNDNHTCKDLTLQNIINKVMTDLDDSQDSDAMVSSGDKDNVITNLFMSNRESIYELQMDEQLETSRSSIRNSFHSEDDAWSLGSLPHDTEEKRAIRYANMTNKELDSLQIPPLPADSDGITFKVNTLDSGNGTQLDSSFATSEMESKTSRIDPDTSTGISTMDSYHSAHIGELVREYAHIYELADRRDEEPMPGAVKAPVPVRPESLRRPDGSSHPNLSLCDSIAKNSCVTVSSPSESSKNVKYTVYSTNSAMPPQNVTYREQSPSPVKHVTSAKKPSILPKPNGSSSRDSNSQKSSPEHSQSKGVTSFKNVSSSSSRDHTRSASVQIEDKSSHVISGPVFSRSHSAPAKSILPTKSKGDKSSTKLPKSATTTTVPAPVRPSTLQQKPPKNQSTSSFSSSSSKNSLASRLPLCNGKRTKDPPSPSKPTTPSSSGRDSKGNGKDSKISFKFRNKSPSPSKRDKESKWTSGGRSGLRIPEISKGLHYSRGGDSDSGNDSGIVKYDVRFVQVSPVTKRAHPRYSLSSGHGSDVSSGCGHVASVTGVRSARKDVRADQCNSSGYESMLRDSEVTGTSSSNHESTSDSGHSDKGTDSAIPKKRSSSKRSKSAPAQSGSSTPLSSRHSSPRHGSPTKRSVAECASPRARAAAERFKHEPIEIKHYDIEDVERMARRRKEEIEARAVGKRREKISALLEEQGRLKGELENAKHLLMAQPQSWSFDLHTAGQRWRDDEDFVEALERETQILTKRVQACKARIMVVTCFDKTVTTKVVGPEVKQTTC